LGVNDRRFVAELPDLIEADEYADHVDGALVRLAITVTADGVEILGDAFRPSNLEAVLAGVTSGPIDQMLCG
jgi:FtsH ternary system-associated peptide